MILAANTSTKSPGACNSAICSESASGIRTRGALGVHTMHKIHTRQIRASVRLQSVACHRFGDVISAVPSPRRSRLARAWSDIPNLVARLGPLFGRGLLPIVNLCRAFKAAGKPSFLCSLLKHRQEPRSGIFHTFSLSPVLCRSVAHERNHDRGRRRDVGAVRQG